MMRSTATVTVLVAVSAALLSPGLIVGPALDAAVFTVVADRVADGATLYRDVWDHKPPGIVLVYAAMQAALPFADAWILSWLASVAATAGTGVAIVVAARRVGVATAPALIASVAAVVGMSQYLLALGGGLTEPIATVFCAVAMALALKGSATLARAGLIGLLLAVGVLISVQVAPGVVAVGIIAVRNADGPAPRMGAAIAAALGAALPLLGAVAWLAVSGGLQAAIDAVIGYTAAYHRLTAGGEVILTASVVSWTVLSLLFLIVPAAMGSLWLRRERGPRRSLGLASLAWIGGGLALILVQGRFYPHYVIPLAVPLAFLAASGIDRLHARMSVAGPTTRVVATAPFGLAAVISAASGVAAAQLAGASVEADHARTVEAATQVRALTADDDRIWVWGNEPQFYLESARAPATRYPYLLPLVTPGFTTSDDIANVVEELRANPPSVIVDAGSPSPGAPGFQPLLIARPLATDGRDLDILDPLRTFIEERYRQVTIVNGWVLYEVIDG